MTTRLLILAAALLGAFSAGCSGASAGPSDTPARITAAGAAELQAKERAERYRLPTSGSDIDTGGAIILVNAPMSEVLEELARFDNYKNIFPRIEDTRVVERHETTTDVYLRAPIMDGSIAIWAVTRFAEPKPWGDDGKQITSRLVKGNLKAWRGSWKVRAINEQQTELRLELFLDVKLPVPDAWITPELMWASDKAVTAIRDSVEKGTSTVKND